MAAFMALFGQKHGAQGRRQTPRPPLAPDTRDLDIEAHEQFVAAADILTQVQERAADRLERGNDSQRIVEPRRETEIGRAAPHDKGDAVFRARPGMAVAETAEEFGAAALGEFEVVGVVEHAGGVGILVIHADREGAGGTRGIGAVRPSRRPPRGLLRMRKDGGRQYKRSSS